MTKFKKCDSCGNTAKKLYKLKDARQLLVGKETKTNSKGMKYQERSTVLFLCKMCFEYYYPDDTGSKNYAIDNFTPEQQPQGINELLREKMRKK